MHLKTHLSCTLVFMFIFRCGVVDTTYFDNDDSETDYIKRVIDTFNVQASFDATSKEVLQNVHIMANNILKKNVLFKDKCSSLSLDPDSNKDIVQLILSQGYPAQKFTVQTQDGFLLSLQRIPFGRNENNGSSKIRENRIRPCVFLQHGLLSTAADWVMNFSNDSLGFLLADAGYDVWLGNSRGNTYSRRHVSLHPDEDRFWDWSFDEMAKYDTTAFIDFILDKTGQQSLYYIGHSQGTIIAFAAFSSIPEYQKKIRLFVGLAPIISINYIKSIYLSLSGISDRTLFEIFGCKDFLPNDIFIKFFAQRICGDKYETWICYDLISLLLRGSDASNLNSTRLQVYFSHSPAGTSVKNMIHYKQFHNKRKLCMYDYGSSLENMKHYGQATPPAYNAHLFNIPTLIFTGGKDILADPRDIKILESTLPNIVRNINIPEWNHVDFIWGMNAGDKCYKHIIDWLPKF